MNLHITKSKNAESFYIAKSYIKSNGTTSSVIVRKLGTLAELLPEHVLPEMMSLPDVKKNADLRL